MWYECIWDGDTVLEHGDGDYLFIHLAIYEKESPE